MGQVPPPDIENSVQTEFPWETFAQFLLLLNAYRKNLLTYPAGHPLLEQSLNRAGQASDTLFGKMETITCVVSQDKLNVSGAKDPPSHRVLGEFAHLLFERGIFVLTLRCGLGKKEIGEFSALLNLKPEEFTARGAEKIIAGNGFRNLEVKEADYSLFRIKGIDDPPDSPDKEPEAGDVWGNFVSALLKDPRLLENSRQQPPASNDPAQLAEFVNQLLRSPETTPDGGDEGVENSVAGLLAEVAGPVLENDSPLLPAVKRFEQFISQLNPYLRRRFHQYLLNPEHHKSTGGLNKVLKSFAAKTLFEIIDDVDQKDLSASENILGLLERFSQANRDEAEEQQEFSLEELPLKDKVRAIFREDISEHYGSEDYHLALHSLLNEIFPAAELEEGVADLVSSLSPQRVEMQQSRVILELFNLNDDSTSKDALRKKLNESITFFLHTGNFSALVQLHKYLLSALNSHPDNAPYYQELLAQFHQTEFMDEVIATLSTWGKENLGDIRYLIRENGNHFLIPLLDRLAEEPNRFMRSFILEELIEIGRKENPEPFLSRLGDKRWYFVRNMVTILRAVGDPASTRELRRMAGHPHIKVRREVIQALMQFRDPMAETLLLQDMKGQNEERKLSAIAQAGSSSSAEIREALLSILHKKGFSDAEMEMKKLAIRSLAGMGDPQSLPGLKAFLHSISLLNAKKLATLKLEIVKNMHFFPKPGALNILNEFVTARDNELSLAARESMKKLQ
jgi:hypothetical protein